ncbi:acyltransferase [Rhizobiaceae bacterium BDR2-2]|uniref:Acyltransferase n=1 Tax=Ectorhizobium quercum TaxID=2965071 RepID=A0AAE3MZT4_9HYPH|nr:acyltransferase family protein [Ectorhizobium quercum]MCX8998128.1 acyltransferase [Ectorhizobium quercum]
MTLTSTEKTMGETASSDANRSGVHLAYRPDIDGLRSLAVLPVVAYHLGLPFVKGGFVGVDVFFVISGYLITGILMRDFEPQLRPGWLWRFYERRARRIFPAFFTVILVSLFVGYFVLFPIEFEALGKNAIAATLFASNIYLYATSNYFDVSTNTNALLHTWSLAVEEQFYLLFPIILLLLCRHARRWLSLSIFALGMLSLGLCVFMTAYQAEAAFYIVFFRMWELLAGSFLAVTPLAFLRKRFLCEIAGLGGLILIAAAVYFYYANMNFPGIWAAAPVFGAAAIIFAGSDNRTLTARLLSLSPLVFIGRISYSLYLWHWPIIVFYHLHVGRVLSMEEKWTLFAISTAAAYISWRFVEQPFRFYKGPNPRRHVVVTSSAAFAITAAAAAFIVFTSGMGWRFSPRVDELAQYIQYDDTVAYRRGSCFIDSHRDSFEAFRPSTCLQPEADRRNVLLIGDSHAAHYWQAFADGLQGSNVMQATASGCKPLTDTLGERTCVSVMRYAFTEFLPRNPVDAVILSAQWHERDMAMLASTIAYAKQFSREVYVIGPIVEYDQSLARLLAHAEANGQTAPDPAARTGDKDILDLTVEEAATKAGATYLSSYRALCASRRDCVVETASGIPVQWDYSHLTVEGARYALTQFTKTGGFSKLAE